MEAGCEPVVVDVDVVHNIIQEQPEYSGPRQCHLHSRYNDRVEWLSVFHLTPRDYLSTLKCTGPLPRTEGYRCLRGLGLSNSMRGIS
jgi:hypothetical protein